MNMCETCVYYVYDEEFEEYFCDVDMDQDDAARILAGKHQECPYWRNGDEYETVRHQM